MHNSSQAYIRFGEHGASLSSRREQILCHTRNPYGALHLEKGLSEWGSRFLLDASNGYTLRGTTPCRVARGTVYTVSGQGTNHTRVIPMGRLSQWWGDNIQTRYGLWALAAVSVCG